ncbi:MAG: tetratricopeptide repeat protein, partial [Persicimonas sp.]
AVDDGAFDVAFERFQRASGLEPNHERRFEDLLEAVKAGQEAGMPPEKLAEVATRATELEANSREAQALAARLWDDAGRPNKALPHYQWLYKVDPEDDKVGARLGTLLLSEGRTGQARDVLEEVHKRAPERAVTGMKLAEALEKLGEDERAEEVYETLLEEHPDRVGVLLRYARFLAAHGKRERARELQEKAGEVQPATEEREMRELR